MKKKASQKTAEKKVSAKKISNTGVTALLVANRGEIACRLFSSAKAMGLKTIAVYSQADKDLPFVAMADEAILLGEGPASESYLNIEKIIKAARSVSGHVAIHPGYGFLSEREAFASAVLKAGLVWVGPKPDVIEHLGNKIAAKKAAEKAKVPTLPWAILKSGWKKEDLSSNAKRIGFPLLLKAAAGGGGRGMRLVERAEDLFEKAESAAREAQGAFGSGELFLERYCPVARHIEVQVLGDHHGNVFCFGERECSAQRRHQKVIEEAPAPNLTEKTRKKLWDAAIRLAKSVGYTNAGTCEFLVDDKENIYFLEVNTRLQVEHPVTEWVWGVDLVALQLRVAQGENLKGALKDMAPRGHAIEARVYAEDPAKGFMPSPGKIEHFHLDASIAGVRVDAGYRSGNEVPIFYDAMLAKVIAWGMDREQAREKLKSALDASEIQGITTNLPYLSDILKHARFIAGKIDTAFLGEEFAKWNPTKAKKKSVFGTTNKPRLIEENQVGDQTVSPWVYFGPNGGKLKVDPKKSKAKDKVDHGAVDFNDPGIAGPLVSQYPGKVLKVMAKIGQKVAEGQVLVVCESMKMEYSYPAPFSTIIRKVHVAEGQIIPANTLLVEWEERVQ